MTITSRNNSIRKNFLFKMLDLSVVFFFVVVGFLGFFFFFWGGGAVAQLSLPSPSFLLATPMIDSNEFRIHTALEYSTPLVAHQSFYFRFILYSYSP